MRHFFTLDGTPSMNFNTFLASSSMWDAPERDVSTVEIPGRNGNLIFDNHRFKNFQATISAYIPKEMQVNTGGVRGWLQSNAASYARYEDSMHPDEFRMARFTGGFALSNSDRVGAAMDITMDCKPQRWLKSGEIALNVASGTSLYNSTRYTALPLIRCNGKNGTLTINGVTVTVSGVSSYVMLDCELMEAYEGSTNRNNKVTLDSGKFPELVPGSNTVTFTGFSSVVITPRWWMI